MKLATALRKGARRASGTAETCCEMTVWILAQYRQHMGAGRNAGAETYLFDGGQQVWIPSTSHTWGSERRGRRGAGGGRGGRRGGRGRGAPAGGPGGAAGGGRAGQ